MINCPQQRQYQIDIDEIILSSAIIETKQSLIIARRLRTPGVERLDQRITP